MLLLESLPFRLDHIPLPALVCFLSFSFLYSHSIFYHEFYTFLHTHDNLTSPFWEDFDCFFSLLLLQVMIQWIPLYIVLNVSSFIHKWDWGHLPRCRFVHFLVCRMFQIVLSQDCVLHFCLYLLAGIFLPWYQDVCCHFWCDCAASSCPSPFLLS